MTTYWDNSILLILFILFSLSAVIQLFYYLYFFLSLWFYKHTSDGNDKPPVSVIICARNEEKNLKEHLPAILEQDYPDYEVIVVNDCSEDGTYNVLGEYLQRYPRLRVSNLSKDPKFTHNKKFAQFIGVKAAKNEFLLFTDADCKPVSDKWIEKMSSAFKKDTELVLGYGGYMSRKGLLNKYIRYDTLMIAMQYFGMAIRKIPYMGVGRNLAYRRDLFFRNRGFGSHSHLNSGDDDLFVNSVATFRNTAVEFRPEAHTRSVPSATFASWFSQKSRHLTTARYYKLTHKILLITEPASRFLFYSLFILLASAQYLIPFLVAVFSARFLVQATIIHLSCKKLDEKGLTVYSLIFDIFSPLINSIIYISNYFNRSGKNRWK
ncbi:MAG: glycosyltransferase [Bacteroidales bacterium]|nr:glycosyltransferase [Bacteroidales bacterium]